VTCDAAPHNGRRGGLDDEYTGDGPIVVVGIFVMSPPMVHPDTGCTIGGEGAPQKPVAPGGRFGWICAVGAGSKATEAP